MRRYGIPASITLAQGIIESADGKSTLANTANNHFGVKGTYNGNYVLANDDKPNEKFKKYDNVGQSYEDHSKVLMASRYQQYTKNLSPDDYKGWAEGIKKGGYATASNYVSTIVGVIESCNLQKYDQMVMEQMKREGKTFGVENNPLQADSSTADTRVSENSSNYSMPVKRDEFMLITSGFGMRMHPIDHVIKMHNGIDISTRHEAILATENNGKVIAAGFDGKGGGNFVKVEYSRNDGSKTITTYCHLSKIDVKVGDSVNAGSQLGMSGSTGKSTGDHLHFAVTQVASDGSSRKIDPAAYLAEIAQKGNIQTTALLNGKDLLAKYKSENHISPDAPTLAQGDNGNTLCNGETRIGEETSPEAWMKKLLSSEDSGVNMAQGDPMMEMLMTAFTGLFALAVQIDNKSKDEQMQMATDAAMNRQIDLSSMARGMKSCMLSVSENGASVLHIDNGTNKIDHQLTPTELNRLSSIINNDSYDAETKQRLISSMVSGISISHQASLNYEQIISQQQSQQQTIQR